VLSNGEQRKTKRMIVISKSPQSNVKKVHCPICGGRLCDVKESKRICECNNNEDGIVLKCYKCGNKISISIM
jgi:transcription elongation factor Elf1